MSLLSSVFKGGSQLALGQVASQACSFLRNLIIARVISPADFGIAATFAMTLSLMEMISNVASEMLLVQSPEGNDPKLQATAQLMKVVRGITNAIILLLLAVPMSHLLFGTDFPFWSPETTIKGLAGLKLSAADLQAIERGNALKLLPGLPR